MLIDVMNDRRIDRIPHRPEFDILRARLSDAKFEAMVDRIDELIDEAGGEIATAGWLPGSDWRGTVFEPIYRTAAKEDHARAAMFFGHLVWYTIKRRTERWACGRYEVDGREIGSLTYFRLRP
jgi:hypothetical protein